MSNRRRLAGRATEPPQQGYAAIEPPDRPNMVNSYRCDTCSRYTVTIDRHKGVTPMFLGCRADGTETGCDGRAVSMCYPKGPRPSWAVPAWEWYKPDADELRRMDPAMRDHIQRGGLALRKIEERPDV